MKRIGRYEVLGQLGSGGMGTVLLARDPELGREVALKLLESTSRKQRERFTREAEGLARIDHPNVVRIHEVGEDGERAFLVMERVHGEDLAKRVERLGPLDGEEVARIGRDVARALEQAHRMGILHRDLKPSNVMLVDGVRPLLTDFGLAHLDDAARLTRSGASLGTPGFWPPEQAVGKRELLGPPSDVWGLGATLYALLSGRPPFQSDTLQGLLAATCEQPPASLQPQVDPALEAIVLRCLEKAPQDRYPTAGALADALERYLAGEPEAPRRRAAALAGATLAGLAGLVGLAIAVNHAITRAGAPEPADPTATEPPAPATQSSLLDALDAARASDAHHAWTTAEDAALGLAELDAALARALVERGGGRLLVLRRYVEGDLPAATAAAKTLADARDPWGGRAWGALTAVAEARRALGASLTLFANMSRRDAPGPPVDGLRATWQALSKALDVRRELSPKLGRLRDLVRAELRATAVAARYMLDGPVRDHAGEREAFEAFKGATIEACRAAPQAYDRLNALEERLRADAWLPSSGDPDLAAGERALRKVPGPAAEVLRIGCLCLLARDQTRSVEAKIDCARRAAQLAARHPDRPLALSVRLNRGWRLLTQPVVKRTWAALRERRAPPYPLDELALELRAVGQGGAEAMVLLALGRLKEVEQVKRYADSALDRAIRIQLHLVRKQPILAAAIVQQAEARNRAMYGPAAAHCRVLLKQPLPGPITGRGFEHWFPWHTAGALPRVLTGEWWWPGEGPARR